MSNWTDDPEELPAGSATAVEWLVDQLLSGKLLMPSLIEEAKAMEKEQIEKAFDLGHENGYDESQGDGPTYENSNQYYNETFGGDK